MKRKYSQKADENIHRNKFTIKHPRYLYDSIKMKNTSKKIHIQPIINTVKCKNVKM